MPGIDLRDRRRPLRNGGPGKYPRGITGNIRTEVEFIGQRGVELQELGRRWLRRGLRHVKPDQIPRITVVKGQSRQAK